MRKVPCPSCGQEIYSTESFCPFCNRPTTRAEPLPSAPVQPTRPSAVAAPATQTVDAPEDLRERLLGIPLWAAFTIVAVSGVITAVVLVSVTKTPGRTDTGIAGLTNQGAMIFPFIAGLCVFRWLEQTLVLWIGLRIMAAIAGAPFEVGFVEGYKMFMPVTMLTTVVGDVMMVVSFTSQTPLMMLTGIVNILIMKAFLDLDWTEIVILNVVLFGLSCLTGFLL